MSKPLAQINELIGFAVMLLMVVAVVAGQSGAAMAATDDIAGAHQSALMSDFVAIGLKGELRDTVLKISMDVTTDLKYFRGEDE